MPRINKARTIEAERNLASRIRMERTDRNWSPAQLAQHMTEAGCTISTSAIYKIEDDEKPRKISVDELVALAEVFGIEDVRDLLKPVEDVYQQRADEIFTKIDEAEHELGEAITKWVSGWTHMFNLKADQGLKLTRGESGANEHEAFDYVTNMLKARSPRREGDAPGRLFYVHGKDGSRLDVPDGPVREALRALLGVSAQTAYQTVAAERGFHGQR